MSTIDTSTWNPDADLNVEIEGIPLNADAGIAQTWQVIRILMAAFKGDTSAIQALMVPFAGATSQENGTQGFVPAPEAGDENKVLQGDGTWGTVAAANHVHGNITSDGKVGTASGKPLVTGTGGAVEAGSFGTTAGTFCEGNDSRLSNARTPTSHTHVGTEVALTGYSKPSTTSAIAAADTVNAAVGKLEKDNDYLHDEFLLAKGVADNAYAVGTANTLLIEDLQDDKADDTAVVHKTGNETIAGTKTFNSTISGSVSGNAGTATKIQRAPDGTSFVAGCTAGKALVNATHTGYGAIWNAKTKNYGVSMSTWPSSNDNVYIMAVTNANIASGTNSYARNMSWNADTGTLTSTAFSGTVLTSSDERLKTPLGDIPDAVLDAWEDVQWGEFQYLEAAAEKGKSARLHLGLIAQRVKAVFEAKGLDACQYGILCRDKNDGTWSVRYAEALAMEAVCQRRRADRLEKRLADLEARLTATEVANG